MTADKLRAKFEAWWLRNGDPFDLHKVAAWETWQAAHASRDAEVEALKAECDALRQRIESAPVVTAIRNSSVESAIFARDLPIEWEGKRVRLVVEDGK